METTLLPYLLPLNMVGETKMASIHASLLCTWHALVLAILYNCAPICRRRNQGPGTSMLQQQWSHSSIAPGISALLWSISYPETVWSSDPQGCLRPMRRFMRSNRLCSNSKCYLPFVPPLFHELTVGFPSGSIITLSANAMCAWALLHLKTFISKFNCSYDKHW